MRLIEVQAHPKVDGIRQTGLVRMQNGDQFEIYFDFQMPAPSDTSKIAGAFAAVLLIPAMRSGESLEVDPPISPQLCFSLPRIQPGGRGHRALGAGGRCSIGCAVHLGRIKFEDVPAGTGNLHSLGAPLPWQRTRSPCIGSIFEAGICLYSICILLQSYPARKYASAG